MLICLFLQKKGSDSESMDDDMEFDVDDSISSPPKREGSRRAATKVKSLNKKKIVIWE